MKRSEIEEFINEFIYDNMREGGYWYEVDTKELLDGLLKKGMLPPRKRDYKNETELAIYINEWESEDE